MRIAWLSPLSKFSDISHHSLSILKAAAPVVESDPALSIDLYVEPSTHYYRSPFQTTVLRDWHDPEYFARNYDVTIFNIGNNVTNHQHINRLCLGHPGVVVVHDIMMQHYWANIIFEQNNNPCLYTGLLLEHYGAKGAEVLAKSRISFRGDNVKYAPWDTPNGNKIPLIEPFLRNATKVVVHSDFAERELSKFGDFDFIRLFLPTDKKPVPKQPQPPSNDVVVASFGDISPPKNYELVIPALAEVSSRIQRSITYKIAGRPGHEAYVARIKRLAKTTKHAHFQCIVQENVSEEELRTLKADSHVFVNIRHPNTETASGSLAEQIAVGIPVVVYASGCYDDLSNETVQKVRELSVEAISDGVEASLRPKRFKSLAKASREHAKARTASAYIKTLIDACSKGPASKPNARRKGLDAQLNQAMLEAVSQVKAGGLNSMAMTGNSGKETRIAALSFECMELLGHSSIAEIYATLGAYCSFSSFDEASQAIGLARTALDRPDVFETVDTSAIDQSIKRKIVMIDSERMDSEYYHRISTALLGLGASDYGQLIAALIAKEKEAFALRQTKGRAVGFEPREMTEKIGQVSDAHEVFRAFSKQLPPIDRVDDKVSFWQALCKLGLHAPEGELVWTRSQTAMLGLRLPKSPKLLSFRVESRGKPAHVSALQAGLDVAQSDDSHFEIELPAAKKMQSELAYFRIDGGKEIFELGGSSVHPYGRVLCMKISDFAIS